MPEDFTWRDGERLIRFGPSAAAEAEALLRENGFTEYLLLTTERARASAPALAERARAVVNVPTGKVDEISADLLGELSDSYESVVALGGGRVVDTAKAISGAGAGRCAAVPTTLSGAELTPFHRLPKGVEGARMIRPALVIADPELMAGAPLTLLAASAMNALAHAMEALYTPLANPVCDIAALRSASLIAAWGHERPARPGGARARRAAGGLCLRRDRHRRAPRALPVDRPHRRLAARTDQRGDAAPFGSADGRAGAGGPWRAGERAG